MPESYLAFRISLGYFFRIFTLQKWHFCSFFLSLLFQFYPIPSQFWFSECFPSELLFFFNCYQHWESSLKRALWKISIATSDDVNTKNDGNNCYLLKIYYGCWVFQTKYFKLMLLTGGVTSRYLLLISNNDYNYVVITVSGYPHTYSLSFPFNFSLLLYTAPKDFFFFFYQSEH